MSTEPETDLTAARFLLVRMSHDEFNDIFAVVDTRCPNRLRWMSDAYEAPVMARCFDKGAAMIVRDALEANPPKNEPDQEPF